jgi:23S rRNA (guanosine2251-2'-O)-methyltransferase
MKICTLNALIDALKADQPVNRVFISHAKRGKKVSLIRKLCHQAGVVVQNIPPEAIKRRAGRENQGVFAEVSPIKFYRLEDILKDRKSNLLLILDGINDCGNLGAIVRTAVAAAVDGIMIPLRDSAPINETVLKASAGALLKARIVRSKNLPRDLDILKESDFWVIGSGIKNGLPYHKVDFRHPSALIVGNEEKGVSQLLTKKCDQTVTIPLFQDIESLNVASATAILLFEVIRQRNA